MQNGCRAHEGSSGGESADLATEELMRHKKVVCDDTGRMCGRCGCNSYRTANWSQKLIIARLARITVHYWLGRGDQWHCAGLEFWCARSLEGTWGNSVVILTSPFRSAIRIRISPTSFSGPHFLRLWVAGFTESVGVDLA